MKIIYRRGPESGWQMAMVEDYLPGHTLEFQIVRSMDNQKVWKVEPRVTDDSYADDFAADFLSINLMRIETYPSLNAAKTVLRQVLEGQSQEGIEEIVNSVEARIKD